MKGDQYLSVCGMCTIGCDVAVPFSNKPRYRNNGLDWRGLTIFSLRLVPVEPLPLSRSALLTFNLNGNGISPTN